MDNETNGYKTLKGMLTEDKPVAFRPVLKRITGSYCAALMLAQLMYWAPRASDEWIYKTDAEMGEEICASKDELQTARACLIRNGFVSTKRVGLPAKMHYRVHFETVIKAISGDEDGPSVAGVADNLLQATPATSSGDHSSTSGGEPPHLSITESTTESTTSADARALVPPGEESEATSPRRRRDPFEIEADFEARRAQGRAAGLDRAAAAHPLAGRWPHLVDLARSFEDANGTRLADLPKSQVPLWAKQLEGHYQADLTPDDERELVRMAKAKKWDLYSPGSADKLIGHLRRKSATLTEPTYAKPSF